MQVKITKPFIHEKGTFALGKTFDLNDAFATELLNAKMAEAVKQDKTETAQKKKPETPEK